MKKMHILVIFFIVAAVVVIASLAMNAVGISAFGLFAEKPDIKEIDSEQLLQVKQTYLNLKTGTGYPAYMTADSDIPLCR